VIVVTIRKAVITVEQTGNKAFAFGISSQEIFCDGRQSKLLICDLMISRRWK